MWNVRIQTNRENKLNPFTVAEYELACVCVYVAGSVHVSNYWVIRV